LKKTALLLAIPLTVLSLSLPAVAQLTAPLTQLTAPLTNPITNLVNQNIQSITSLAQSISNPLILFDTLLGGSSSNWLNTSLTNTLSASSFGLSAEAFPGTFSTSADKLINTAYNYTALTSTPDFGKLVNSLAVAKNIPGYQAVLEARNSINTSVVSDQGRDLKEAIVQESQLAQQSASVFSAPKAYDSTLEAVTNINEQQGLLGNNQIALMAQGASIGAQMQVSNELALQRTQKDLSEERSKTQLANLTDYVVKTSVETNVGATLNRTTTEGIPIGGGVLTTAVAAPANPLTLRSSVFAN
jgi:hypothetical protein